MFWDNPHLCYTARRRPHPAAIHDPATQVLQRLRRHVRYRRSPTQLHVLFTGSTSVSQHLIRCREQAHLSTSVVRCLWAVQLRSNRAVPHKCLIEATVRGHRKSRATFVCPAQRALSGEDKPTSKPCLKHVPPFASHFCLCNIGWCTAPSAPKGRHGMKGTVLQRTERIRDTLRRAAAHLDSLPQVTLEDVKITLTLCQVFSALQAFVCWCRM